MRLSFKHTIYIITYLKTFLFQYLSTMRVFVRILNLQLMILLISFMSNLKSNHVPSATGKHSGNLLLFFDYHEYNNMKIYEVYSLLRYRFSRWPCI